MKGIYHDLGNSRIKTDTVVSISDLVKNLKATKAKLTAQELQNLVQSTVYSTGSKADALVVDDNNHLIVKKPDIYYSWDVSSIIVPTGGAGN
jgi:molybdopterin biosynthesis enzyme MoaB